MKKTEIAARQFFILTFGLTVGTSVLVTPSGLAYVAREDAWIASLISLAINLLMVLLYITIMRLYPGKTLFEINELVFGRWIGKAITLLYLFYFLILAGTLIGNLGFFLTSEILQETPIQAVQLLFLAAAVMCARLGIVILARVGELMFPWIIFFFVLLALALVPQIEWNHIRPVLEDGWAPVLKAGIHSSMFQELIVMMVLAPKVMKRKQGETAFWSGSMLGNGLLATLVLLSVLILGIEQTANSTFPAFVLAKTINIGNFIQRLEGILVTLWVMTFFIKTTLLFFSILSGIKTVFHLKSYHSLVYPIAVLFIVVAWNTYLNSVYIADIIQKVWAGYSMIHLMIIPVLLLAAGFIRTKLAGEQDKIM